MNPQQMKSSKVKDDEILVNSYVRKKTVPKALNPMQRLGQRFSSMMPKSSRTTSVRVKGRNNNKYNFSHSWVLTNSEDKVNTPRLTKFASFFSVPAYRRSCATSSIYSKPISDFKMKWSTKEKISQAQRLSNSNYKHGNRLDYRYISNWIPNEIIHHIDGNHHNNSEDNLISIPGYIPDTNEINTLGEWKRIVNCKLHEEIHRRACKDEVTLPSKDDILSMVDREYPNYYDEVRPKLLEHYESLKIRDKYIDGNSELEQKISKLKQQLT